MIVGKYDAEVLVVPRGGFKRPTGYDVVVRASPTFFMEDSEKVGLISLNEMPDKRAYKGMKFGIEVKVRNKRRGTGDILDSDLESRIIPKDPQPLEVYLGIVYKIENSKVYAHLLYDNIRNVEMDKGWNLMRRMF